MTEEPRQPPRFLTLEQAAQELNTGIPIIRSLLKSGELRALQVGARGVWRIGRNDLETYIEEAYRRTAEKIARGEFGAEVPEE